jgi:putative spermidine/putrescine transport system substrate-binding protein
MTLACYAGDIQTTMEKYILPGFEKKYNVSISYLPGISAASIAKLQAEKSHPQIDAACLDDGPAAKARSFGLLQPFDTKTLTNLNQVSSFAKLPGNVGVGWGVLGIGIVYAPDALKKAGIKPPTSWNDLENPKLKGHLVVDTISSVYGTALLDMLAYANGGSETNINPGFSAMKKVKPNVMTFDTTADMSPYFEQGGAWEAVWTDAESSAFVDRSHYNMKFVYPKEGSPVDMTTISVVKGAANADLANDLANYLISKQAQYLVSTKLGLGPANKTVVLPKAIQSKMPYGPAALKKLRQMNWKVINAQLPSWTDRWNREIEH